MEPETSMVPDEGTARVPSSPQSEQVSLRRSGRVRKEVERFWIIGAWLVMIGVYSALRPSTFATTGTLQTILGSQTALVFLVLALMCTIAVGEFVDLSVASILGLSATVIPVLHVFHGTSIVLASAIAVAIGAAAGALNGFFVVILGVNTIVITLGMSTFLLGIGLLISHLNAVSGLPPSFADIAIANIWGLPVAFYYGLVLVLVFAYILVFTPLGRHMEFVGSNREVSRLAGVRVNRIRFGAFVMAGLFSGVGGVVVSAGLGGFDPSSSVGYLLPTVSAVFLSATVIQPGRFNPLGAIVGLYFLATGELGLEILGAAGWVADVFYGAALIIAVALSSVLRGRPA
jgi:ribose transport system permease protein